MTRDQSPYLDEQNIKPVPAASYLDRWPGVRDDPAVRRQIATQVRTGGHKVIVIDDDPTGCQTVHDVPLLLEWSVDALLDGLQDGSPVLFVLTNARAVAAEAAAQINRQIARNLREAAGLAGVEFVVVSRSDSTLRGHFPQETDALDDELGPFDGVVIAPCFFEAGRHTVEGVHWVRQGDRLIPAAMTESAADPNFGFGHSYLPAWIEEKTAGRTTADRVLLAGIQDIRVGGAARVADILHRAQRGQPIVVDAIGYADLETFVAGLLLAEAGGQRFLYRTAASFVRVRGGIDERPLLTRRELLPSRHAAPGLVAVGSFVPRTTAQLTALLDANPTAGVELDVLRLLDESGRPSVVAAVLKRVCDLHARGETPVVYTSRQLVAGDARHSSLEVMNIVSAALVGVARQAAQMCRFGFLVAKGGITSHDLAFRALDARRARVLGQIAAGVPVWRLGPESLAPDMPYVVFPGNVGEAETLTTVVASLRQPSSG